jgi:hypothetical protein
MQIKICKCEIKPDNKYKRGKEGRVSRAQR